MRFFQWAGCLCAMLASLLAGCEKEKAPPAPADGPVVIVASVFPIADLVKQIGGSRVEVRCLLEAGRSPYGYSPPAASAGQFAGARLLFVVGMGLDDWAVQAARDAGSSVRIVRLTTDPDFLQMYSTYLGPQAAAAAADPNLWSPGPTSGPADEPASQSAPATGAASAPAGRAASQPAPAPPDPYVWTDPVFMQGLAGIVLGEMVRTDAPDASAFAGDANSVLRDLQKLDEEYAAALSQAKAQSNCFLTFAPNFGHLARRYGLRQLALDGTSADSVSQRRMEEVRRRLKERGIRAIFTEPQYPRAQVETLAKELGVGVGRLDALGDPYEPGYDSYQSLMRSNLRALVQGLTQPPAGKAPQ